MYFLVDNHIPLPSEESLLGMNSSFIDSQSIICMQVRTYKLSRLAKHNPVRSNCNSLNLFQFTYIYI